MKSTRCTLLLTLAFVASGACVATIEGGFDAPAMDPESSDVPDAFPNPGSCPGGEAAFASLRGKAEQLVNDTNAPGVALAIVCGGKLAHSAGLGQVKAGGAAVDADTLFQLASSTKMFTAAAAVRLADQGIVDLDAPISNYIANLDFGQLTLRELLSHSAGFPGELDSYSATDLQGLVRANQSMKMWAEAGAVWNYSNTGYLVAGAVLEAATGQSFDAIIKSEVFRPAAMTGATMSTSEVITAGNFAYGHEGNTSFGPNDSYYGSAEYGPMGGAWASVHDMGVWAEAHFSQQDPLGTGLMSSLRRQQIRTGVPGQGYGLGLFVDNTHPAIVHHGGNVEGFSASFMMVPASGFAVVVLSHGGGGFGGGIELSPDEIAELAIDTYQPELSSASTPAPATNAELVGTYKSAPSVFGEVIVSQAGGSLQAEFVDKGFTRPLVHWYADAYGVDYEQEGEIDITFWREPGQSATHIVSRWGVAARQ